MCNFRSLLHRYLNLLRRRLRARRLGIRFFRRSTFQFPNQLRLADGVARLNVPPEPGCGTAFIDIFLNDCYGLETFPDQIARVLDIGSHAGLFCVAARRRWPKALIHAYEPNPAMARWISQQAEAAHFVWWPQAVGKEAGRVTIQQHNDSVQTRALETESGEVERMSFSTALKRMGDQVDLVKLDCEGAEWEILDDTASWQAVRHLTMEYHLWAGYSLEELQAKVRRIGMEITLLEKSAAEWGVLHASRRHS